MSSEPQTTATVFKSPLPLDPIRLLYGVRERWLWFIVLPLLFGLLGWMVGTVKSDDRYSVSLQLIKSKVSTAMQTSDVGQAFQPRELSDDTLLSTTYSTEVLERTGARLEPARSSREVKAMVEIIKQRNTALFYLTAHSRKSAKDAIVTVTIWADEVIRFTNNLQREEARQMESFISEQLDNIEAQLKKVNDQILDFARTNQFVDADSQTSSALAALDALRNQLANTRISVETKGVQIERYRQELRAQSPLEGELKRKREELNYLRGRYTDVNPLVKEKLYEIEYLEEQLKAREQAPIEQLKDFTGSALGNNLYLEVIGLENERTQLERMLADLERRLESSEATVAKLPEKALRLNELKSRRDQLIRAQSLLESRRKEAAFYESKAPGYWQVFQKPSISEVAKSSQNAKSLLLGMLGLCFGWGLALVVAISQEALQAGMRTPIEAAIASSTIPVCFFVTRLADCRSWMLRHLFNTDEMAQNERALRVFWLTHEITNRGEERKRFLFVPTQVCEGELSFWLKLCDLIHAQGRQLAFCNLGGSGDRELSSLAQHPAVLEYHESLDAVPEDKAPLLFVRLGRAASVAEMEELKRSDAYYLLTSPSLAERYELRHRSELMRKILGQANGLLILEPGAESVVPRLLRRFEMLLMGWYAQYVQGKEEQ